MRINWEKIDEKMEAWDALGERLWDRFLLWGATISAALLVLLLPVLLVLLVLKACGVNV